MSDREPVDQDAAEVARYESLLETLAEGIVLIDTAGKNIATNPAAERILHRSAEQLHGVGAGDTRFGYVEEDGSPFPPDRLPGRITRLTGEPCNDVVIGIAATDEDVRWVSMTTRAIRRPGDEPPFRVVVSMVDVTERRAAEARNRELVAELERSNAELEQFASILAHDLAAPLRVIRGFAELLASHAGERLEPAERTHLLRIAGQAETMQAMIDALRDYARMGGALAPQQVDTSALVSDVLARLEPLVAERGADVSVAALPPVHADPTQLGQVFQNLLENALTHGSGDAPVIRVWADRDDDAGVTFAIADDGAGVPEERRARMFEMFTRGAETDETGGMGVGLAICRRIVQRHHGRIWIEDAQPGALVRFTLGQSVR